MTTILEALKKLNDSKSNKVVESSDKKPYNRVNEILEVRHHAVYTGGKKDKDYYAYLTVNHLKTDKFIYAVGYQDAESVSVDVDWDYSEANWVPYGSTMVMAEPSYSYAEDVHVSDVNPMCEFTLDEDLWSYGDGSHLFDGESTPLTDEQIMSELNIDAGTLKALKEKVAEIAAYHITKEMEEYYLENPPEYDYEPDYD